MTKKSWQSVPFDFSDVDVLDKHLVFEGHFRMWRYLLRHKTFDGNQTGEFVRECFEPKPAVTVLPYDPVSDCVVLIQQFRTGALKDEGSPWLLEIVAGVMDVEGESPQDVAFRELQEETGLVSDTLETISEYWVSPGGSHEYIHLFCAKVTADNHDQLHGVADEHEDIRTLVVPRAEAVAAMEAGLINNSSSIIALQWIDKHHERLRKEGWQSRG
jgi:ADP-ribose diphosphatase